MDTKEKIVTEIPLLQIWDDSKILNIRRDAYLTKTEIKQLLRIQPVKFIVANVGNKLEWIENSNCFSFWKNQAEQHIAENLEQIDLNKFPNETAYIASKWTGDYPNPIILLESIH